MYARVIARLALLGAAILVAAWWLAPARAQPATQHPATTYTQPMTPWGEPDLQGVWGGRHQTVTPLERPQELGGREFLTDEEIAARQKDENDLQAQKDALVQRGEGADLGLQGRTPGKGDSIQNFEYNTFWVDTGAPAKVFRRTSLIVGPEGRIPYKPEVLPRVAYTTAVVSSRPPDDFVNRSWQDRDMGERCITDGTLGMIWAGTGPTQNPSGARLRRDSGRAVSRPAPDSDRWPRPWDDSEHAGRGGRSLGRQHAGRRDEELQRPDPELAARPLRAGVQDAVELDAPARALHAHGGRHDRIRGHGHGSRRSSPALSPSPSRS